MKLWLKNYLFTCFIFIIVLYACVFFLADPPVSALLTNAQDAALSEEYAISRAMDSMFNGLDSGSHKSAAASFAEYYEKNGIYLEIKNKDDTLFSTLPYLYAARSGTASWTKQNGETYIHIADELSSGYSFVYAKSVEETVQTCIRQCVLSVIAGTVSIFALCIILYVTLKKINEPVDRLAHELRTPLTAISGYAETLMISRLTDQQRHLAAGYIFDESRRLSEISEKLLTMSGLRERTINKQPVDIEELFSHVKRTYGRVEYTVEWSKVLGDRALLQSLIGNLMDNAFKASQEGSYVELVSKNRQIIIRDHGKGMDDEQLKYVNDPTRKENPFERKGLGIPLCHEIARLHKAVLQFTSEEGVGTEAIITFYK